MFVKVAEVEEKTASGILLPTSAQRRPTSGDVVAIGDGRTAEGTKKMTLKEGETVLYSRVRSTYRPPFSVCSNTRLPPASPTHHYNSLSVTNRK